MPRAPAISLSGMPRNKQARISSSRAVRPFPGVMSLKRCKTGSKSLDVAAYFKGHGFTNVHSMRGGIEAWAAEVDPAVPRY